MARCELDLEPRLRYWRPAAELRNFVSGYHLFCTRAPKDGYYQDTFWPGWMHLRLKLNDESSWHLKATGAAWFEAGRATVFGPTSGAVQTLAESGIVVGAGITPLGWLALNLRPASEWADRIGNAEDAGFVDLGELVQKAARLRSDEEVQPLFDRYFAERLNFRHPQLDRVQSIMKVLVDPNPPSIVAFAEKLGVAERTLQRLCSKAFGFTPQLLMRRARFLRSLAAIREATAESRSSAIDETYTDYPHFVRDSHRFLGMSPRKFFQSQSEMAVRSLEYRKKVLGKSTQALFEQND